jgi:hypothetical protein
VLSGRARLNQILSLVLSATVVASLVLEAVKLEGVVSVTCSLMVEFAVFIGVTAGGRVGGSACAQPGCPAIVGWLVRAGTYGARIIAVR